MSYQRNLFSVLVPLLSTIYTFPLSVVNNPFSKEQVYGNYVIMHCKLRRYNEFETYVKMKCFYNRRFQQSTIFNYGSTQNVLTDIVPLQIFVVIHVYS